jgi:hypothetical protein
MVLINHNSKTGSSAVYLCFRDGFYGYILFDSILCDVCLYIYLLEITNCAWFVFGVDSHEIKCWFLESIEALNINLYVFKQEEGKMELFGTQLAKFSNISCRFEKVLITERWPD